MSKVYSREKFKKWLKEKGNTTPWKKGDMCPIATYMRYPKEDGNETAISDDELFAKVVDKIDEDWKTINAAQALAILETIEILEDDYIISF